MALYYEAATILSSSSTEDGSLKSRIYDSDPPLRSSPALVYGLIKECSRWDNILSEVIDHAGMLANEPKLTPLLSLLLVHDLLLSKRGIASPQSHPLRVAVEKHKTRLAAELTRSRLRRRCASIDALREHVCLKKPEDNGKGLDSRWIRINRLKTTLSQEMSSTFSTFTKGTSQQEVSNGVTGIRTYDCDPNIPDMVATNASTKEITSSEAFKSGSIVLQDKASCFPAHLLLNSRPTVRSSDMSPIAKDVLDACAAPGNKTTHLASILSSRAKGAEKNAQAIYACERDPKRSETLKSMVNRAGASEIVRLLAKQDFLALNPDDSRFRKVTHLLLDPTCSGSGIFSREDVPDLVLPKELRKSNNTTSSTETKAIDTAKNAISASKKRKRNNNLLPEVDPKSTPHLTPVPHLPTQDARLEKLSNLQTHIIEHAFKFPAAQVVTYSTCSTHAVENEMVAMRALASPVAMERGWRVLRRGEQPVGLSAWSHRGVNLDEEKGVVGTRARDIWGRMTEEERRLFRDACIRCIPGAVEGTIGFFVVGFVKDPGEGDHLNGDSNGSLPAVEKYLGQGEDDEEWHGFSDEEEVIDDLESAGGSGDSGRR